MPAKEAPTTQIKVLNVGHLVIICDALEIFSLI